MINTVRTLSLFATLAAATLAFGKPYPRGIIDLPEKTTAKNPIETNR